MYFSLVSDKGHEDNKRKRKKETSAEKREKKEEKEKETSTVTVTVQHTFTAGDDRSGSISFIQSAP
jgi:hypothetical protein